MKIKKCLKCGALVHELDACNCNDCGIKCCNEEMHLLVPNETDAAFEKHVPEYEIQEDKIIVKVNHVMEEDHYIKWICCSYDNKEDYVYLEPGNIAIAVFPYIKGSTIYSFCNKHNLWSKEVE